MNRRGFIKWLGLAPAAPLAVKAADKFAETAKASDMPRDAEFVSPPVYKPYSEQEAFTSCTTACMPEYEPILRSRGRSRW